MTYPYYLLILDGDNDEEHMEYTYKDSKWLNAYIDYKKCVRQEYPQVQLKKVIHSPCGAIVYKQCKKKKSGGK